MDDFEAYLLTWIIVGSLVGLYVGQARGRRLAGFLLGTFLGLIGWLLILSGPDRRPKCAECGGIIVSGARRCLHCGQPLPMYFKCPACGEPGFTRDTSGPVECPICRRTFSVPA